MSGRHALCCLAAMALAGCVQQSGEPQLPAIAPRLSVALEREPVHDQAWFSPDGNILIILAGGNARLISVSDGSTISTLYPPSPSFPIDRSNAPRAAAVDWVSSRLAFGTWNGNVWLWDWRTGSRTLLGANSSRNRSPDDRWDRVGTVVIDPTGSRMVTIADGGWTTWDLTNGTRVSQADGSRDAVAFSEDGATLYAVRSNLEAFDPADPDGLRAPRESWFLDFEDRLTASFKTIVDGDRMLVVTTDGAAFVVTRTGHAQTVSEPSSPTIPEGGTMAQWSGDRTRILLQQSNRLDIINIATGVVESQAILETRGGGNSFTLSGTALAVSDDAACLAMDQTFTWADTSYAPRNYQYIGKTRDGRIVAQLSMNGHNNRHSTYFMRFSRNADILAVSFSDNLYVYDVTNIC